MLAVEIDGEFYFPALQAKEDLSDRLQYSFFMEERNTVLNGLRHASRTFTVAEILKTALGPQLMAEIHRLVRVYGTQDAV